MVKPNVEDGQTAESCVSGELHAVTVGGGGRGDLEGLRVEGKAAELKGFIECAVHGKRASAIDIECGRTGAKQGEVAAVDDILDGARIVGIAAEDKGGAPGEVDGLSCAGVQSAGGGGGAYGRGGERAAKNKDIACERVGCSAQHEAARSGFGKRGGGGVVGNDGVDGEGSTRGGILLENDQLAACGAFEGPTGDRLR